MSGSTSETISQLTPAALSNPTDIFPTTQASIGPGSGTTRTVTQAQIIAAGGTITASRGLTFSVPNVTAYPPQAGGYVMQQDTTYVLPNTATAGIYFGNEVNFVVSGNPQGTQVWHNLDRGFLETSNSANIDMVVRFLQAVRTSTTLAPATVMQGTVIDMVDQTGAASSIGGGMTALELDLECNDTDNGSQIRQGLIVVLKRPGGVGTAPSATSAMAVFAGVGDGYFNSIISFGTPFRDAGIDFRSAGTAPGGTDNAIWLRTGQKLALDNAGAAGAAVVTLQSVLGLFGQYVLDIPQQGIQFDGHTSLLIAPDANSTVLATFVPWRLQSYTVAALPVLDAANHGALAFATNGRNNGEGGGAGTGCLVSLNTAGTWLAVWSGVAPTI